MSLRRKIIGIVTAGAVAVSLTGCSTTQIQQVEAFIGQVQAYTAQVCKFVPTVATIVSIVNSGIGQVVGAVGSVICNSVPAPTSARYKALAPVGSGGPAVQVAPGISGWRTK